MPESSNEYNKDLPYTIYGEMAEGITCHPVCEPDFENEEPRGTAGSSYDSDREEYEDDFTNYITHVVKTSKDEGVLFESTCVT